MKYSDQQRIEKMRETTEKLLRYVEKENITPEKIFAEEAVQWTVTTPLYNIGEHAANLSEDFKKQYPDIPWVKIAGLNEARFSNIFIEKRASTCPQSLEKSRLFSYALLVSECENFQNMKRIFLRKVVI